MISAYLTEGGMGAIYLGKRVGVGGFEKDVVLKQLLPELTSDREITELFLREARLSAALDHQNIVHTMDLLEVAGRYYIVMEYVRGGDLRSLLRRARRRSGRLSPAAAILIGRDLLDALDYAHKKQQPDGTPLGLIHRDISPSNILLSTAGEVKLTDFGIAKSATQLSQKAAHYQMRGKVGYMSPEQARSEEIDARSDLFSLAVVLYEVLTGQRLFIGAREQPADMVYGAPVPPLSRFLADPPPELTRVMTRALSLDRGERFQTALEFHEALSALGQRHGLIIGHAELAVHLRQVLGPPADWLRDEERTSTAMISADQMPDPEDDAVDEEDEINVITPVPKETAPEGALPLPGLPAPAGAGPRMHLDTTSRVWLSGGTTPAGPVPDTTQPMPRQAPDDVGIAEMARRMVTQVLATQPAAAPPGEERREGSTEGGRGEDTRTLEQPTSATTRMVLPPSPAPPVESGRAIRISGLLVAAICITGLFLICVGMIVGTLLSRP